MSLVPHHLRLASDRTQAPPPAGPMAVDVPSPADVQTTVIDPKTGAVTIELDDGSVEVDFDPKPKRDATGAAKHDANLADYIDGSDLAVICADLLQGVDADDASRAEWLANRARGIELLGLTIDGPKSDSGTSAAPLEGMSTVRHPMLLEAVLRFQANARGELLPSGGPVKVENALGQSVEEDDDAEILEKAMNFWLTKVATEYYPDTDQMLLMVGAGGCSFKKVYHCPLRRRPVSETVDAKDLIISSATTDIKNAVRVTHRIKMKPSTLKRMQIAGAYRDVALGVNSVPTPTVVDRAIATQQGVEPTQTRPEDADRELFEVHCELNIPGFEHKAKGVATGLAVPYRVVIDKDAQQILEVRRNWAAGDDEMCFANTYFVKYPFVPGLGFYSIGLINILGNSTLALTAAWRMCLDSGMFANFPGFLYAKPAGRQLSNEFRVAPGSGVAIDTQGGKLSDAVMPLPYKDASSSFVGFIGLIEAASQKVGGTAELSIGEGKQDAPVGTTLALIEQAQKILDAVHKRIHAAQAEEFGLLKQRFREDPEAFLRACKDKGIIDWDEATFIRALNDYDLSPQADPNTPSHMHRLMKATALGQLASLSPGLFDEKAVATRILKMVGFDNTDSLFNKDKGQQPDPKIAATLLQAQQKSEALQAQGQIKMAEIAAKAHAQQTDIAADEAAHSKELALDAAIAQRKSTDAAAERASKEKIAALGILDNIATHPESSGVVNAEASRLGAAPQPSGVI